MKAFDNSKSVKSHVQIKKEHRFADCNPVIKLGAKTKFVKLSCYGKQNVNNKFKTCLGLLNQLVSDLLMYFYCIMRYRTLI